MSFQRGTYTISYPSGVPVTRTKDRNSAEVCKLPLGREVVVAEIASEPVDNRIRARLVNPAGWISLCCLDGEGYDYAEIKTRTGTKVKQQRIVASGGKERDFDDLGDSDADEPYEEDRNAGVGVLRQGCLKPIGKLRKELLDLKKSEVMHDKSYIPKLAGRIADVYIQEGPAAVLDAMAELVMQDRGQDRAVKNHKLCIVYTLMSS